MLSSVSKPFIVISRIQVDTAISDNASYLTGGTHKNLQDGEFRFLLWI